MIVWSALRRSSPFLSTIVRNCPKDGLVKVNPSQALVPLRLMSGGHFHIKPNKWQFMKWKDMVYFYIWVGMIPWICVITYTNLFIGPAKLAPIPEGYKPKEWEYYRHPITRFIARYMIPSIQEDYERYLHRLYEDEEKVNMNILEKQVLEVMASKKDYKLFWHRPVTTKYLKTWGDEYEKWEDEIAGDNVTSLP